MRSQHCAGTVCPPERGSSVLLQGPARFRPPVSDRGRRSAATEQGTAQPAQRCEERNPPHSRAPAGAVVRGVTCGELAHQGRRLGHFTLRDGGATHHREMAVKARTGRAAPTGDRRDSRPATHCYLFHVTPHPYEGTRPGQVNPIAPSRHSCIPGTGFTSPVRALTITLRIRAIPGRVGQPVRWWAAGSHRTARRSRRVMSRPFRVRWPARACRRRGVPGSAVSPPVA